MYSEKLFGRPFGGVDSVGVLEAGGSVSGTTGKIGRGGGTARTSRVRLRVRLRVLLAGGGEGGGGVEGGCGWVSNILRSITPAICENDQQQKTCM